MSLAISQEDLLVFLNLDYFMRSLSITTTIFQPHFFSDCLQWKRRNFEAHTYSPQQLQQQR